MFIDLHPILNWFRQFEPVEATSIVLFAILGGIGFVALIHSMLLNPKDLMMSKVKIYISYIIYWFATNDERHLYDIGVIKGMRCTGYTRHLNGDRTYHFNPWEKPVKNFLTWKEYKNKKATEAAS